MDSRSNAITYIINLALFFQYNRITIYYAINYMDKLQIYDNNGAIASLFTAQEIIEDEYNYSIKDIVLVLMKIQNYEELLEYYHRIKSMKKVSRDEYNIFKTVTNVKKNIEHITSLVFKICQEFNWNLFIKNNFISSCIGNYDHGFINFLLKNPESYEKNVFNRLEEFFKIKEYSGNDEIILFLIRMRCFYKIRKKPKLKIPS